MIRRTNLPTMKTASYDVVMGTIKMGIKERKLTAVFGTPGSGKTTLLNDIEMEYPNAHRILCSPTMTMKNLMVQIANSINAHVKGDTYTVQHQLTEALASDSNHILLFDESEYLHHAKLTKIDVLRQIYDETNTPMVLCGTYELKSLLSGSKDHNQSRSSAVSSKPSSNPSRRMSSSSTSKTSKSSLSYVSNLKPGTSSSPSAPTWRTEASGYSSISSRTH